MEKIRNLSLKKSIVLYMTLSLLCSFLISAFIVITATHVQQQVWWRYVEAEIFSQAQQSEADNYEKHMQFLCFPLPETVLLSFYGIAIN